MKPSSVSELLYNHLEFASQKQKVISANIANINTPGYKTKDIDFADALSEAKQQNNGDLAMKVTQHNHINPDRQYKEATQSSPSMNIYEVDGLDEQNDGNNVSLNTQMAQMSKNNILFNAVQASIRKDASWFKEVIASSGKN